MVSRGAVPSARWLDADEMHAWQSLLRGHARLLEQLDAELRREHGLTLAEYEVLAFLSAAPSTRLRMSHLAQRALVSASALTRRVDRLEHEGLVERRPCPTDGRVTWAVLTRKGRRRLEAAAPTHVRGVRSHFLDLLSRGDLRTIGNGLERVALALEGTDPAAATA